MMGNNCWVFFKKYILCLQILQYSFAFLTCRFVLMEDGQRLACPAMGLRRRGNLIRDIIMREVVGWPR